MLGFWETLRWEILGADKYFQEGLTINAHGGLKKSITKEI